MTDNIYTYFVDLPVTVNEMVTPCSDGYTIYINARLDRHTQIKAYQHALGHIGNRDWEKFDVQEIEFRAHKEDKT